ncbi:GATOR2 complex protein WDR24 isoform X1 [Hydra vulgaris]|uniref:GATOR2 complex protein WDR24 isoform X1 n=1 Tax=Hydra vulgaris TaxID=6087 RepID=UPI00064129DE|nr:GATOR complex protein WDR24 [Hydra vulgaris]
MRMARNQDKSGIQPLNAITFQQTLPCSAKAICKNKEGTQCAVGGSNLLKIFSIEEKRFVEKLNLVAGPRKLNHSISDLQWHPMEDNIIASAAGNGVVILWDLNKEQKQDHIFQQHYRFVNKICFHPTDPTLLMSCSQDGNMNCFDIRRKDISVSFCGKADSIRDVQFHRTDKHIFCAAGESGNVQLWDMRKHDHYYAQFTGHSGPVFALDWHLEEKHWLATGGRDSLIKIWDTQACNHPIHTIETIASVARIKWRPNYKYHISSCALILDNNINIWDIRRPYVPFAAFQEHKDVATGFVWQRDPDVMLSCSKDKTIIHHTIRDAERPALKAPSIALGLSPRGMIGYAFPNPEAKLDHPKQSINAKKQSKFGLETQDSHQECSIVNVFEMHSIFDEMWISSLAKEYIFFGKSVTAMCEHNSKAAKKLGFFEKAQVWAILGQLYYPSSKTEVDPSPPLQITTYSNPMIGKDHSRLLDTPERIDFKSNNQSTLSSENEMDPGLQTPSGVVSNVFQDMTLVGPELDAVFGDEDCNEQLFSADVDEDVEDLEDLPREAFQLRQSFNDRLFTQSDTEQKDGLKEALPISLELPPWNFDNLVKEVLFFYAQQGDIQMSVTVLLVLNSFAKGMVEKSIQEDWFYGYIEILSRLHLFNIATEVINHAPAPVNTLNQNSTVVHMQCGICYKVLSSTSHGWYCRNCKRSAQICAICHIPVKGLYLWCQGCGHGGHLNHIKSWFSEQKFCPIGCGHKCEYS